MLIAMMAFGVIVFTDYVTPVIMRFWDFGELLPKSPAAVTVFKRNYSRIKLIRLTPAAISCIAIGIYQHYPATEPWTLIVTIAGLFGWSAMVIVGVVLAGIAARRTELRSDDLRE